MVPYFWDTLYIWTLSPKPFGRFWNWRKSLADDVHTPSLLDNSNELNLNKKFKRNGITALSVAVTRC